MSVWRDMGFLADGSTFGVDPFTFLSTAYAFWSKLNEKCFPNEPFPQLPAFDFNFRWKNGDSANRWDLLNTDLMPESYGYYRPFVSHPVPVSYWTTAPDWAAIKAISIVDILGESIIPCPYERKAYDVMRPEWPKQRYKIIQMTRYVVVPLDISYNGISGMKYIDDNDVSLDFFDPLTVTFPNYWAQAESRKVGINGESGKPISGNWWAGDSYIYTFSGGDDVRQSLRIYGAVDLATHPDFAQYFDVN